MLVQALTFPILFIVTILKIVSACSLGIETVHFILKKVSALCIQSLDRSLSYRIVAACLQHSL